jgi:hypothetical protein
MLQTPGVFSPRLSFTGRRKLAIFFGGRPTGGGVTDTVKKAFVFLLFSLIILSFSAV